MAQYSWLIYPVGAALSLASADFFLKLASSRMSASLVTLIYALTTIIPPTVWLLISRARGEAVAITNEGIFFAILTGLAFSFVVVFLNLTFASGVNLSLGTPVIRMAGIIIASTLGILVFREDISLRYVLGFGLALIGIYFIITK